jgi:hypothetical protein
MDYAEKLKDPRWQKKRLEILNRDHWTCKYCGEKERTLHVHHLFYFKDKDPWEVNNGFLVTLCEGCHLPDNEEPKDWRRQDILETIGNLLKEIWTSGYSISDLMNIQEAVFNSKRRLGGALIDITLDTRYLEDYDRSEITRHGVSRDGG